MTGIPPSGFMKATHPIAELAASMAAFKVDTEVRREEAAEAREEAFQGADTQEKNAAVELLKENKALTDLYAQAQKELTDLKAQLRNIQVDKDHTIALLEKELLQKDDTITKLKAAAHKVIDVHGGKDRELPVPPQKNLFDFCDQEDRQRYMAEHQKIYNFRMKVEETLVGLEDNL